jgi:hypothetical protein
MISQRAIPINSIGMAYWFDGRSHDFGRSIALDLAEGAGCAPLRGDGGWLFFGGFDGFLFKRQFFILTINQNRIPGPKRIF